MSLSLIEHNVCLIHHDHGLEHLLQSLIINTVLILFINDVAVLIHHSEALNLFERTLEFHVIGEFVFKQLFVHLVHGTKCSLS